MYKYDYFMNTVSIIGIIITPMERIVEFFFITWTTVYVYNYIICDLIRLLLKIYLPHTSCLRSPPGLH